MNLFCPLSLFTEHGDVVVGLANEQNIYIYGRCDRVDLKTLPSVEQLGTVNGEIDSTDMRLKEIK